MLKRFFSPKSEAALSDRFSGVAFLSLSLCVCVCPFRCPPQKKVRERDPQQLPRRWSATTPRPGHSLPVNSRRSRLRCFKTRSRYCLCSARITTPSARKGFPSLTELRTPHAALNIVAAPPAANGSEGEGTEGAGPERRVGLRRQVIGGS